MKRKLWWRLAGVGALTLFFLWQLTPLRLVVPDNFFDFKQWKVKQLAWLDILRPGIDLAGGTRLVYQVDTTNWKGAGNPAEEVIAVLKTRLNPDGTKDIQFRAIGNSEIEIVIPRATASSTEAGDFYKEKLNALLAMDVMPSDLDKAAEQAKAAPSAAPSQRLAIFDALIRGVQHDPMLPDPAGRLKPIDPTRPVALARVADDIGKIEQAQRAEAAATQPQGPAEILKKDLDDFKSARLAVLASDLKMPDLQRVLRMSKDERNAHPKDGEGNPDKTQPTPMDALLAKYPDRAEKIKAVVAANDEWKKEKQALDDPNDIKRLLRGTGVLNFYIGVRELSEAPDARDLLDANGNIKSLNVPDKKYLWVECDPAQALRGGVVVGRYIGQTYVLVFNTPDKSLVHTGDKETDWKFQQAYAGRDEFNNPDVNFVFDEVGGEKFGVLTQANLKKMLCAVLDNKVISIATIDSRIGSKGLIHGSFSQEEAQDLAQKMQAGALPSTLSPEPISESSVDPQLGTAQRSAGLTAAVIGLIAVVGFMAIYYFVPLGLVADIAVVFNLIYLLGMMAWGKFSFTMPGIAGLILTVGIAVDANVLIDERIREEQAKGLPLRTALKNGYSRAFSVIIDAHITAIMTSIILYLVGTTEIRGFATTLIIGLIFSLFTSVFLTRWLLQLAVEYGWIKGHFRMLKIIGVPKIRWMDKRYIFWVASALFIAAGITAFFVQDPKKLYDVEFIGGTKAQVTLAQEVGGKPVDVTEEQLTDLLKKHNVDSSHKTTPLFEGVSVRKVELGAAGGSMGETFEIVTPAGQKEETSAFRAGIVGALSAPNNDLPGLGNESLLPANRDKLQFKQSADWAPVAQKWRQWIPLEDATRAANRGHPDQTETALAALAKTVLPDNLPPGVLVIRETYASDTELKQAGLDKSLSESEQASLDDVNLDDYRGGVGVVVSGLQPATLEDLRARISAQLSTPEYLMLPSSRMAELTEEGAGSGWELYGLTEAGAAQGGSPLYTAVLYVARGNIDPDKAKPDNPEWLDKFALPEIAAVHDAFALPQQLNSLTYFSPSVASDLVLRAWLAIVISMIAIMIYIWVRFGNWLFGLGAIVPIFHDSGIVIGLIAISKFIAPYWFGHALLILDFRFDMTVVAAVLTVIGYSTNDTIVVFDRIRENRGRLSYVTGPLIDSSVNQTLSRTILTSLTVLFVVIIMYVFGGQGIRAFNYAMLVGVVVGTYSSIAIAAPVLLGWRRMVHKKLAGMQPAKADAALEHDQPAGQSMQK